MKATFSSYQLIDLDRSSCSKCDSEDICLLKSKFTNVTLPSFYICFQCWFIGEIGVGEVKAVKP